MSAPRSSSMELDDGLAGLGPVGRVDTDDDRSGASLAAGMVSVITFAVLTFQSYLSVHSKIIQRKEKEGSSACLCECGCECGVNDDGDTLVVRSFRKLPVV